MNKWEKVQFVDQLIGNVRVEIMVAITGGKVPEEWDGHELREYIAEKFVACRSPLMRAPRSKRKKDYHNAVLVNNL